MFAIGELINIMQRGNASLDRVNETFSFQETVENPLHPVKLETADRIDYKRVSFRYPSSKEDNLTGISIQLLQGQTLGIVGKTGSGKTTLIKQLLRQYPLGSGELSIAGVSLKKQTLDQVRKWIGYVPQDHVLFSRSVKENILFGNKEATEEDLERQSI